MVRRALETVRDPMVRLDQHIRQFPSGELPLGEADLPEKVRANYRVPSWKPGR